MVQLHVVVEEADSAAGERRAEDRQRRQRVVGERQERERELRRSKLLTLTTLGALTISGIALARALRNKRTE